MEVGFTRNEGTVARGLCESLMFDAQWPSKVAVLPAWAVVGGPTALLLKPHAEVGWAGGMGS